MRDELALALIVGLVGISSCLDCTRVPAEAQSRGELDVVRMLCGEADGSVADWHAILWTVQRRADRHGMSLPAMARAYSAPLRGHGGARGRWVRALPVLPTPGYAATWRGALETVRAYRRGAVADPCARASFHFGSVADVRARFPRAVPIDCGVPEGGNVFISEDGS